MAYLERYYLENINNPNGLLPFDDNGQNYYQNPDGNGEEYFGGGGGGGASTGGGISTPTEDLDTTATNLPTAADDYIVRITTQFPDARPQASTVYLNGIPLPNTTPKDYTIKLSELFTNGPQEFEVRKGKYITNQKYVLSVVPFGDNKLDDITLLEDVETNRPNGVNQLQLDIKYYEDGQLKPYTTARNGTLIQLPFTLYKKPVEIIKDELKELTINLIGPDSSVQFITPDEDELLDSGEDVYEEKLGTTISFKSPNTSLYRISEVTITDDEGNTEKLTAGKSESVSMEILLSRDLKLDIVTKNVIKKEVLKPVIRIKGNPLKKYNINDKTDIPIIVEKNDDVKVISLIIGDEILEFDSLTKGKYQGITIPSRLVDKIGTYNVKLIPYSISELLAAKKNTEVKELPPPPPPKNPDKIIREQEVIVKQPDLPPNDKPVSNTNYTTPRGGGSGGSGGGPRELVRFDQLSDMGGEFNDFDNLEFEQGRFGGYS
jgi:hypothetical protein